MAFYVIVLDVGPTRRGDQLVVLTVLVFVPVRYVYPSRTELLRSLNLALAGVWLVTYAVLLAQYPDPNPVVVALSLGLPRLLRRAERATSRSARRLPLTPGASSAAG